MKHEKFNYRSLEDVRQKLHELNLQLPLSENIAALNQPITVDGFTIPNRLALQPMEGCDGTRDGRPDEWTIRRYERFAVSGAGLIWLEAVAVVPEGRANPRQLFISEKTVESFKRLIDHIKQLTLREHGFEPVMIMQATHSGRYAKPDGVPAPIIAYNNPVFEKGNPITADHIITDDRLRQLEEQFGRATRLARQAGFDGIDIKACHRYLNCELLSAYTRPGDYGGSFDNRTRLLRNGIQSAQAASTGRFLVTSRLNIYDGFPYPYGWGVNEQDGLKPDLAEPQKLIGILHHDLKVNLLNLTMGNPYVNPHVNRPYDQGGYIPDEHPLEGIARMMQDIGDMQKAYPDLTVISSGLSYLRQFSGNLAAGMVEHGYCAIAGFGREAFAYPAFAADLLKVGRMDEKKCCITCGKCSELMRAGSVAGCVVRDHDVYLPIYQRDVLQK